MPNKSGKSRLGLLSLLLFVQLSLTAQNSKDSTRFYISPMLGMYTSAGTIYDRSAFDLEFGIQYDALSHGFDVGKTYLGKRTGRDTTYYFEIRPSLNVFEQGKFTNTLTLGVGYIMNAEVNIMTELTAGIEYHASNKFSYNIFFGTYYFSGRYAATSLNFFGA